MLERKAKETIGVAVLPVSSPAFSNGAPIPAEHSRDGGDRSPAIQWSRDPQGTKCFALICDDPDAPGTEPFVHWVIYNIPAGTGLPAGISREAEPQEVPGARQGRNDYGDTGYGGPRPPRGHGVHHYQFSVYALNAEVPPRAGMTKKELLAAIEGHVVAMGRLVGTFER